jgi:demethylmenaquinone methyltransferase/2-methoxy-6-polyprenyl-1,4-benzoquinol methylase
MKKETTDFGFTEVSIDEKQSMVNDVFHSVASRYDIMNDLMSFGIHRLWKRHAISHCQIRPHHHVLDLASGTGDLAISISALLSTGKITLSDINASMLAEAKRRLLDNGIIENAEVVQANAESLPFSDNTYDRAIMAFGLRNVTHKDKVLSEIYRVLKPGGRMIILEFSHPTHEWFSKIYDHYSFKILPKIGKYIAKDEQSYQYLAESIRKHPDQKTLKRMILTAKFDKAEYQNLTGGVVAIHKGIKY